MHDWQSIAALAVVIMTAVAFALRAVWRRCGRKANNSSGCGGGCGCPMKPKSATGGDGRR